MHWAQQGRAGYYPAPVEDQKKVQLQRQKSLEVVLETLHPDVLLLAPFLVRRDHSKGQAGYCSALVQDRKESYLQRRKENPEEVQQDPRRGLVLLGLFLKQGRFRCCPLDPY